ncbi:amidophosphoribosyltransferase [Sulfurimicrobium lacus]|uniref:Amidophosphoribosyltransferase n=1 Tax=Sulfurimicrobium lacus TaxID=2715678 RepID=A0A6F8V7W6_9PROT|nr:ComF family protein [Sulfurimicrobium lacus]BCB25410.1 amidophosphoribosyltransferase [Sulfurimicrobium lacus]
MSNYSSTILNGCAYFNHIILPHDCLLCGAPSGREALCPACHADLPWHRTPQCPRCALPTTGGTLCGHCLQQTPAFERTLAAFTYDFPLDTLIQALKYGHQLAVLVPLATALAQQVSAAPRPDVLIAMPLHPLRLRERGFNQALELAKIVARRLDIPLLTHGAERIRATVPQVGLPLKKRAGNLRGAFTCSLDLQGKHVAILDDVMTTGASLRELALTLRRQGAREISAWVVARTVGK